MINNLIGEKLSRVGQHESPYFGSQANSLEEDVGDFSSFDGKKNKRKKTTSTKLVNTK